MVEQDWQHVSEPEMPVFSAAVEEDYPPEQPVRTPHHHLLLTMQLVTCIVLAVAAFALKSVGGAVYEQAREWYLTQLNDEAVFDGSHGLELLLPQATADEA